jgi:hypothetical protein
MKKALFFVLIGVLPWFAWGENKFALVIGNGNYTGITRLNNPVNDAADMGAALRSLGFQVELVTDGDLDRMERTLTQLKNRLSASKNSYGFFYYAGHGVQANGENYLIPVDASIPGETYLKTRALAVQNVLSVIFKKTGGIIYGSDAGAGSANRAGGKGDAVYISKRSRKINIPRGRAPRYVVLIRYLYSGFIPL